MQSGFLSILYSIGSQPLQIWDKKCRNGHIKRITDNDIQSSVLEIMGTNVSGMISRLLLPLLFLVRSLVVLPTSCLLSADSSPLTRCAGFDNLHLLP
jgi:hypothetical protein